MRNLALGITFLLAACGGSETAQDNATNPAGLAPNKTNSFNRMFGGGAGFAAVSADESLAAEVGRDVLAGGGNAVDAAVAMYFAMAVTLPSAAGLGATGVCIEHDAKSRSAEAFVFGPVAAPGPVGGVPFAVPSGVRAIALMHIRHGLTRWEALVAPAERLARNGIPVSRALSRDLQAGAPLLGSDPEARRVYGRGTGTAITEGDIWSQTDLAGTLGGLRQRGGSDFFAGSFARLLSTQVQQMGGSLPLEALRNAVPQTGAPASESYGSFSGFKVYVAPAPMAGASALAGWSGQPGGASGVTGNSEGISGLVAVDSKGNAAACSLSMGQLFGTRRMVPGTGILLGAITATSSAVSPLIIANPGNGEFRFAGAGGGSPDAAFATGAIARAVFENRQTVGAAMSARNGRGGYVNAIACPEGIRGGSNSCQTAIDPAGSGLAMIATSR